MATRLRIREIMMHDVGRDAILLAYDYLAGPVKRRIYQTIEFRTFGRSKTALRRRMTELRRISFALLEADWRDAGCPETQWLSLPDRMLGGLWISAGQ